MNRLERLQSSAFNVDKQMKRTKSVLTMRNLAASIKHSIQLDARKQQSFQPFKTTKSQATLRPSHPFRPCPSLSKEQKDNRIFVLEKQITNLEKQLKESTTSTRSYDCDLALYDQVAKRVEENQNKIIAQKSAGEQLKNQILMLQQEIHSTLFNVQEYMAEKEYQEELIETYGHQYEAESKLVFTIVELEHKNETAKQEMAFLQEGEGKAKKQLQEWKGDIEFDLNQHKLKNSIKMVRMKLIGYQDQCDDFCSSNNLRKLRELYCLFFKNHAKANGIASQQAEEGIDIFICNNNLCQQFSEFVRERLVYNKPKFPLFEQYLSTLASMQQIYRKSIYQANRKMHSLLQTGIKQLQIDKASKIKQIKEKQVLIKQLNDQIDDLFNNESIAVIQYMREKNRNKYDLKEIKAKLRENKRQQKVRINKIRQSLQRVKHIERMVAGAKPQEVNQRNMMEISELSETLIESELHLEELEITLAQQCKQKDIIEEKISNQITKWRQVDQKKEKLSKMYKELQEAKKTLVDREFDPGFKITKNHNEALTDLKKASFEDKVTKCDPSQDVRSVRNHSKNTSVSSLNQSKSVLSLSNPFKKAIEKSVNENYQPILTNCQMILSRKLAHKELQMNDLEERNSNILKDKTHIVNMNTAKPKGLVKLQEESETIWNSKNKTTTITPFKKTQTPAVQSKGKVCISQRQSLSKLLISRFNR